MFQAGALGAEFSIAARNANAVIPPYKNARLGKPDTAVAKA